MPKSQGSFGGPRGEMRQICLLACCTAMKRSLEDPPVVIEQTSKVPGVRLVYAVDGVMTPERACYP